MVRGTLDRGALTARRPLTARQAEVLTRVRANYAALGEPVPVALLARQLGISYKGAGHHIEALHAKGYVDRASSPIVPQ